ncbi:MAG: ATP-binding protein [Candidatus Aenigmarchaeota archaeon]|nr:ATP-binding protein [Candidatus Aenigmarchaeota archaeon]
MTKIRQALVDMNPWWEGGFRAGYKEREIYGTLQKFMRLPQIMALTGLRRVGKTTLMLKMAEDAIRRGLDPRSIVYFSFDEFGEANIRGILEEYEAASENSLRKGKYLVMLDEIQKVENWEDQLKAIYDLFKGTVKIVISGSESLFIRKKSKETLAGRIFEFKVEPLSFREFLIFRGFDFRPIGLHERELRRLFDDFILTLGFPELADVRDKDVIKKYVKESIVEKVVYRDIQGLFRVKDVSVIESLLNIMMEEPGQIMEVSEIGRQLGVSRQTASIYLSYLEKSFLIRKLYNYSKSRRKVERKLKKYYPAIVSAELLFKDDDQSKSKVFEWAIVNEMRPDFFWRDPYKNEVDIILPGRKPLPIEIKYGKTGTKGLLPFMEKTGAKEGYVVSRKEEGMQKAGNKTIHIIPAFRFLLERPWLKQAKSA